MPVIEANMAVAAQSTARLRERGAVDRVQRRGEILGVADHCDVTGRERYGRRGLGPLCHFLLHLGREGLVVAELDPRERDETLETGEVDRFTDRPIGLGDDDADGERRLLLGHVCALHRTDRGLVERHTPRRRLARFRYGADLRWQHVEQRLSVRRYDARHERDVAQPGVDKVDDAGDRQPRHRMADEHDVITTERVDIGGRDPHLIGETYAIERHRMCATPRKVERHRRGVEQRHHWLPTTSGMTTVMNQHEHRPLLWIAPERTERELRTHHATPHLIERQIDPTTSA